MTYKDPKCGLLVTSYLLDGLKNCGKGCFRILLRHTSLLSDTRDDGGLLDGLDIILLGRRESCGEGWGRVAGQVHGPEGCRGSGKEGRGGENQGGRSHFACVICICYSNNDYDVEGDDLRSGCIIKPSSISRHPSSSLVNRWAINSQWRNLESQGLKAPNYSDAKSE